MLFAMVPEGFWVGAFGSVVFGLIGIVLLLLAFFLFDVLLRKVDFQEKLNEGNLAVAIVIGSLLLSVAYVAAHVVR